MTRNCDFATNTLGFALLGLLARCPQTGYDLAQGLKDPVSFFWNAKHSQIYPQLAKLEASGLIEHTLVEQSDQPDKKIYHLTPAGRKELQNWINAPTDVAKQRDELILKAYSIWLADPPAAAQMMREHVETHTARLACFKQRLEELSHCAGPDIDHLDSPWFGEHAALRRGIGCEREYLAWCEWMVERLSAQPGVEAVDEDTEMVPAPF